MGKVSEILEITKPIADAIFTGPGTMSSPDYKAFADKAIREVMQKTKGNNNPKIVKQIIELEYDYWGC